LLPPNDKAFLSATKFRRPPRLEPGAKKSGIFHESVKKVLDNFQLATKHNDGLLQKVREQSETNGDQKNEKTT
jgi:hypothetical protein